MSESHEMEMAREYAAGLFSAHRYSPIVSAFLEGFAYGRTIISEESANRAEVVIRERNGFILNPGVMLEALKAALTR